MGKSSKATVLTMAAMLFDRPCILCETLGNRNTMGSFLFSSLVGGTRGRPENHCNGRETKTGAFITIGTYRYLYLGRGCRRYLVWKCLTCGLYIYIIYII